MRDHQIKAQCEAFAQRGPWGHIIRQKDEATGITSLHRVSFGAAMRLLIQQHKDKTFPAKPRASKGRSYIQFPHPKGNLGPRMIVG